MARRLEKTFADYVVIALTPVTNLGDVTAANRVAQDFIAAIGKHRHWDRANIEAVPA